MLEDGDENFIGAAVENGDEGFAHVSRHPERREKKNYGDHIVLPAIETPLMSPNPHRMLEDWAEIIDRPKIGFVGSARAEEVAKQVEVER